MEGSVVRRERRWDGEQPECKGEITGVDGERRMVKQ